MGKCWNCQETGHRSSDCPNPRKNRAAVNALSEGAAEPTAGGTAANSDEWAFMGMLAAIPEIGTSNRYAALSSDEDDSPEVPPPPEPIPGAGRGPRGGRCPGNRTGLQGCSGGCHYPLVGPSWGRSSWSRSAALGT